MLHVSKRLQTKSRSAFEEKPRPSDNGRQIPEVKENWRQSRIVENKRPTMPLYRDQRHQWHNKRLGEVATRALHRIGQILSMPLPEQLRRHLVRRRGRAQLLSGLLRRRQIPCRRSLKSVRNHPVLCGSLSRVNCGNRHLAAECKTDGRSRLLNVPNNPMARPRDHRSKVAPSNSRNRSTLPTSRRHRPSQRSTLANKQKKH